MLEEINLFKWQVKMNIHKNDDHVVRPQSKHLLRTIIWYRTKYRINHLRICDIVGVCGLDNGWHILMNSMRFTSKNESYFIFWQKPLLHYYYGTMSYLCESGIRRGLRNPTSPVVVSFKNNQLHSHYIQHGARVYYSINVRQQYNILIKRIYYNAVK